MHITCSFIATPIVHRKDSVCIVQLVVASPGYPANGSLSDFGHWAVVSTAYMRSYARLCVFEGGINAKHPLVPHGEYVVLGRTPVVRIFSLRG